MSLVALRFPFPYRCHFIFENWLPLPLPFSVHFNYDSHLFLYPSLRKSKGIHMYV